MTGRPRCDQGDLRPTQFAQFLGHAGCAVDAVTGAALVREIGLVRPRTMEIVSKPIAHPGVGLDPRAPQATEAAEAAEAAEAENRDAITSGVRCHREAQCGVLD